METGWYFRGAFLRGLLESVEKENQSENCYYNEPTFSTGLARAILQVSYRTWSAVPPHSPEHCSQSTLLRKVSLRPNSETQWVKHLCASEIISNGAERWAFGRFCRSHDLHVLSQTLELRARRNEIWANHSDKITPLYSIKYLILNSTKKKKTVTSEC